VSDALVNPHRTIAPRIEDAPTLPKGPSQACPACGEAAIPMRVDTSLKEDKNYAYKELGRHPKSPLPRPRACSPAKRVRVRFFRRCNVSGSHLHESCKNCGHEWLTSFAGELTS